MKTPKNYYPMIAAAALGLGALIPVSFGDEKKNNPDTPNVVVAKQDPVEAHLNETIVNPLNLQATQRMRFSRMGPRHSTSYHLVEITDKPVAGERKYQLMMTRTSFRKGSTPEKSEFLKVRYIEKTQQTLVSLKETWVTPEEHPILKMLPKAKPQQKITP